MADTSAGESAIAMTRHERDGGVVAAGRFQNLEGIAISAFHATHLSSIGLAS